MAHTSWESIMTALLISLLSCSAAEHDTAQESCSTAADCGMSFVWVAACEGDVLQTPVGSGAATCDDGVCRYDFAVDERDCALEGLVCGADADGVLGCIEATSD